MLHFKTKIFVNIFFLSLLLSISSCCTKTIKPDSDQDVKNNMPKELILQKNLNNISPGTVDINAEVISFSKITDGLKSKLRVNKVNKYGGSTPVLPIGEEIVCDISDSLIHEKNQSASEIFEKGNSFNFLIHYQSGAANGDSISSWRVISFK